MNLFTQSPDPYAWARRIGNLRPNQQKRYLRLEVFCETGSCWVAKVYDVDDGRLVRCRSEANIKGLRENPDVLIGGNGDWSKRRAFFITDELMERGDMLTLVCQCQRTVQRLVSVRKINDLADSPTRRASINAVLSE